MRLAKLMIDLLFLNWLSHSFVAEVVIKLHFLVLLRTTELKPSVVVIFIFCISWRFSLNQFSVLSCEGSKVFLFSLFIFTIQL